jgi:hypothetical protein
MPTIIAMDASPPTTPPAIAPTLLEAAGVGFGVGIGIVAPDIDVVVEVDVPVLEEAEVLEDCRGDSIELSVVARLVKLDPVVVAVVVAVTVAVGTITTVAVARLVTNEVAAVVVTGAPTIGYPFIEQ